jgi:2-polyprenyl-3-methyl-5-hydroxy-6-metoxy-1,4-benzoquinol methylase
MPLANSYLAKEQLLNPEAIYPLHAKICNSCNLVQVVHSIPPEDIFDHYHYFSSYSPTWLKHAENFVESIIDKLNLNSESKVVEIASNDGYLLQYFMQRNIQCLGIEPAANVAEVSVQKGINTLVAYFGSEVAKKIADGGHSADLIISNNVLAHVPDINDFVKGIHIALKPKGVWSVEFPHLLNMLKHSQFDTIYHEHYSYLSLLSVEKICSVHGLKVFDLEEIPTHGGSLRLFISKKENVKEVSEAVKKVIKEEENANLQNPSGYTGFADKVNIIRDNLINFLMEAKSKGAKIAGYGAAAKGSTLLNFCGINCNIIDYVVDDSPYKQNTYLPQSHIPIVPEQHLSETKPDYVLILPWNLAEPISKKIEYIKEWGGKCLVAIPKLKIF